MYMNQTAQCPVESPVRRSEIARELDELGQSIASLRDCIGELSKKISPILANTPTACSPDKQQICANNTAIGKCIREHITTLLQMREGVVEMISKVEV
jgi:hypothetical protein